VVDEQKRETLRSFAAIGAGGSLLGFGDDAGESDAREAIAGYVEATPGAHFSKIRDDLGLATGETQYHLRRLVDTSVLSDTRDGNYRRYFVAGEFSAVERQVLGFLRRETHREIVLLSLVAPDRTGRQLAANLGVSGATVSAARSEMAEAGVLNRDAGYRVNQPETVIALLLRYAGSFDERTRSFVKKAPELVTYDPD
jgi:predicted transcriptional regulator